MAEKQEGRRGRSARGREREAVGFQQLPWQQVKNPFPPFNFISDDQVEDIHNASLQVLEEIGLNFLLPEARERLRVAGADVSEGDTRVRFDRGLIEEYVAKAPSDFTVHARNPAHNLHWGGNVLNFAMVASPPNVSALDIPRTSGTFEYFCDFLKLAQSLNIVHCLGGYPVEPVDLPPKERHLDAYQAMVRLCDKVNFAYALGDERIRDALEMARIARGLTMEQLCNEPSFFTVVNANSPLQYDIPMLQGMTEMALHNQPVIVTPFTLAGAMAPVTIAGALVQQNAEALAGIAYMQIVNAGAPTVYG
ncbi:MAG: methyltransferase, partial [Rhodospirillales bacterium]|nr:methyltransferase [Rhodospirillales bacterium]